MTLYAGNTTTLSNKKAHQLVGLCEARRFLPFAYLRGAGTLCRGALPWPESQFYRRLNTAVRNLLGLLTTRKYLIQPFSHFEHVAFGIDPHCVAFSCFHYLRNAGRGNIAMRKLRPTHSTERLSYRPRYYFHSHEKSAASSLVGKQRNYDDIHSFLNIRTDVSFHPRSRHHWIVMYDRSCPNTRILHS